MCVCVRVCMYACIHACMHVCMRVILTITAVIKSETRVYDSCCLHTVIRDERIIGVEH